jgi:branched-chain amino acid transport system substrate-binding protein
MKNMRARFLLSTAAAALLLAMAGCSGGPANNNNTTAASGGNSGNTSDTSGGNGQKFKKAYEYSDIAADVSIPNNANRKTTTAPGNKVTGDKIIIGLVASQNGDLKPWGDDSVKGAQLAVDEANAAGGVQGKQIDLHIEDSGSKPEQGKSAAEKLISDGAIGILGEVASGITAQMGQIAFEKGIPDIAIGATKTDLTDIGNNMFRVCYTDAFQGPVMAHFAYDELGCKKVAIMTDRSLQRDFHKAGWPDRGRGIL